MKCDKDIAIGAGERRTFIRIHREAKTPNETGGYKVTFFPYASAWVLMEQASGNERYKQNVLSSEASWKFSGVYGDLSMVQTTDRIEVDGRFFNIRNIEDVERRQVTIRIRADEGVTQ